MQHDYIIMITSPMELDSAIAVGDRQNDSLDSVARYRDTPHNAQVGVSPSLLGELVKAGFTAEELKQAGFPLQSLKDAGFNLRQLKDAGFDPSEFKDAKYTLDQLKECGFTAEELRQAGFDLSSMQAAGFNPKQLKHAGFNAAAFKKDLEYDVAALKTAGFTAKEIIEAEQDTKAEQDTRKKEIVLCHIKSAGIATIESQYHKEVRDLVKSRTRSGHIFGHTWYEFFGFFAPYGTRNSFWSRLKESPMLRHIFVFSPDYIQVIGSKTLLQETPSPQITVSDVDSSVNNCALICALLIGIPAGIVSNMGSSELYTNMITSGSFWFVADCTESMLKKSTLPGACIESFKAGYRGLVLSTTASFYTNIFSLLLAVMYYMCRPSESYNISSNATLLEAFTLEVRQKIRDERHQNGPESGRLPTVPFDNPAAETEVFLKASHLAQNEAEEQKNQEFYVWYNSKSFSRVFRSYT